MENQSRYRMVTIQNIDTQPFKIEYNISDPINGYQRELAAGQVVTLVGFIADLAVKHLIDQILTRQKININNKTRREELASKIIINIDEIGAPVVKSPERQAIDSMDKYNRPSDLDKVLARRKAKATPPAPINPATPPATEEKIVTHEEDKTVLKEDKDEPETFEGLKNATPLPPTRQQLYDYAHNKLGMELDDKTMVKFENMGVPELIKELDYNLE